MSLAIQQPAHAGRARETALAVGTRSLRTLVGLLTLVLDRLSPSRGRGSDCCSSTMALKSAGLSPRRGSHSSRSWQARQGIARIQRRGRPGIAPEFPVCLPSTAANDRPPDSLKESISRATTVNLYRLRQHNPHSFTRCSWARETLPAAQTKRLNLCGLYGNAPHTFHTWHAPHFLPTTHHKSSNEKYLGVAQAAFPCPPIAPHVPRGNHCARRATRGRQQPENTSSHGMARQACRKTVRRSQPRGDLYLAIGTKTLT